MLLLILTTLLTVSIADASSCKKIRWLEFMIVNFTTQTECDYDDGRQLGDLGCNLLFRAHIKECVNQSLRFYKGHDDDDCTFDNATQRCIPGGVPSLRHVVSDVDDVVVIIQVFDWGNIHLNTDKDLSHYATRWEDFKEKTDDWKFNKAAIWETMINVSVTAAATVTRSNGHTTLKSRRFNPKFPPTMPMHLQYEVTIINEDCITSNAITQGTTLIQNETTTFEVSSISSEISQGFSNEVNISMPPSVNGIERSFTVNCLIMLLSATAGCAVLIVVIVIACIILAMEIRKKRKLKIGLLDFARTLSRTPGTKTTDWKQKHNIQQSGSAVQQSLKLEKNLKSHKTVSTKDRSSALESITLEY